MAKVKGGRQNTCSFARAPTAKFAIAGVWSIRAYGLPTMAERAKEMVGGYWPLGRSPGDGATNPIGEQSSRPVAAWWPVRSLPPRSSRGAAAGGSRQPKG
ncbi:hypothetical protein GUJ93_ZPchr0006g42104 [Zizania palustris]|uniref:Uncharacterized protein n=1 Tax=Zizania palustris TaxID=103762 RepID=A0A8J5SZG3_ZIZPA|nr:hypothetical protein GUJ93_ZPchr0006g42104 [Zizania palustris]